MGEAMRESCHTRKLLMYPASAYSYWQFRCEHRDEDYGMGWVPNNCPLCGGKLVIIEGVK